MKRCSGCKLVKEQSWFNKNRSAIDGLSFECRDCVKARCKAYYERNRVAIAQKARAEPPEERARKAAQQRARRAADPEKYRAWKRASYARHIEKNRQAMRDRRIRDPILWKERDRLHRLKDPAKTAAQKKAERHKNAEKYRASARARYAKNPEKKHTERRNRQARRKGAPQRHSVADIAWLFDIQKGRCAHSWCRRSLKKSGKEVDHIVPLALGGANDRSNLQLLCPDCNRTKGWKHPVVFAQSKGMLL